MSAEAHPRRVIANETALDPSSLEQLLAEIAAYLAVVDAFRRSGVEPSWAPERRQKEV